MPYQIRQFQVLSNLFSVDQDYNSKHFLPKQSFEDLYVFKQEIPQIGIKFRDIELKKYGYKIKSVQVKIDVEEFNHSNEQVFQFQCFNSHFKFYQNWKKYEFDFPYKLLKPQIFKQPDEIQRLKQKQIQKASKKGLFQVDLSIKFKSFEAQLQDLNEKLVQRLRQKLGIKSQLNQNIYQKNLISNCLNNDLRISEIFLIHKNKLKTNCWETGKLIVKTFSGKIFRQTDKKGKNCQYKSLFLQTFSQQSKNKNIIQQKIDPISFKKEQSQKNYPLSFEQIYKSKQKEQNMLQRHKIGYKFKSNISYPQLIKDLYCFYRLKQQ